MKLRLVRTLLASLGLCASLVAQPAPNVERSVSADLPAVQTRTYEKDGKLVTERLTTTQVKEVEAVQLPKVFKAAIFVANRAGAENDKLISILEDHLTARVQGSGFQVLSREIIANALTAFDPAVASSTRSAESLDAKLTEQSSALRLGQNLGADYLLVATIDSIGTKQRTVSAYGVNMTNVDTNLRATYKVIDGNSGATLASDVVKSTVSARQTENAHEQNDDAVNELLDQAAEQLGNSLKSRVAARQIPAASAAAALVEMTISVEAADLYIPDVRIGEGNTIAISEDKFKVSPLNVTVEIDGVAMGTAPGKIKLRPGFSKLRLTRDGFKTWERTINAVNGMNLSVAMELSPEGYARWKESTAFMNDLKNGAKLTDAQVKVLEGQAEMLKNSYFRVNLKEGLHLHSYSLFGNH
ncbi:PEGA domain-containing protein [Nibricoccus sp. IMCC34717]|uniref:PEGA domain-containing protein n=1 Tax=Nibricoccus sp. IMCC34717 TaxID=3034021 RepID=UPI00384DB6F2